MNSRRRQWSTWLRQFVAAAVFAAGVAGALAHRQLLGDAFHRLNDVRWEWVAVAVGLEALSLALFARLQRWLLGCGGVRIAWREILGISLAGNAVALTLPGGAAFAAAWSFRQLRRRGADRVLAGWVVLMAGALSSFALFLVLAAGAVVAGGRGPVASLRWLAVALASIPAAVAVVAVAVRWVPSAGALAGRAGDRVRRSPRFGPAATRFLARLGVVRPGRMGWVEAFAVAASNWITDLGCLIASILAVGGQVPWSGILVAYGLGRLVASLPITPGGLAVVEGSLSALLIAYGLNSGTAVAAVLLYRAVSFWALVPVGWAIYAVLSLAEPTMSAPDGVESPVAG